MNGKVELIKIKIMSDEKIYPYMSYCNLVEGVEVPFVVTTGVHLNLAMPT